MMADRTMVHEHVRLKCLLLNTDISYSLNYFSKLSIFYFFYNNYSCIVVLTKIIDRASTWKIDWQLFIKLNFSLPAIPLSGVCLSHRAEGHK